MNFCIASQRVFVVVVVVVVYFVIDSVRKLLDTLSEVLIFSMNHIYELSLGVYLFESLPGH
jgi:hypothetical protein